MSDPPNAFDAGLRVLFNDRNVGVPAVYITADGARPTALRVVLSEPSDAVQGTTLGRVIADSLVAQMLVSDVPIRPASGARLVLRGRNYRLSDVTRSTDGRVWRAVLSAA